MPLVSREGDDPSAARRRRRWSATNGDAVRAVQPEAFSFISGLVHSGGFTILMHI